MLRRELAQFQKTNLHGFQIKFIFKCKMISMMFKFKKFQFKSGENRSKYMIILCINSYYGRFGYCSIRFDRFMKNLNISPVYPVDSCDFVESQFDITANKIQNTFTTMFNFTSFNITVLVYIISNATEII